jgi:hypothetical protein
MTNGKNKKPASIAGFFSLLFIDKACQKYSLSRKNQTKKTRHDGRVF